MNKLKSLLSKLQGFFTSGKAEHAFDTVASLVPKALPIVQAIAAATPNKSVKEIIGLFSQYGVPLAHELLDTPPAIRGYALLHLATEELAKQVPGTPTNLLNAAVQLAVTAVKAG